MRNILDRLFEYADRMGIKMDVKERKKIEMIVLWNTYSIPFGVKLEQSNPNQNQTHPIYVQCTAQSKSHQMIPYFFSFPQNLIRISINDTWMRFSCDSNESSGN